MIKIKNVNKVYKNKKNQIYANQDINLEIPDGKIVGFLGANGAGKTTLIKMICNLISPTSGSIEIDNVSIQKHPDVVHKNVGVLLEGARNVYNFLTIEENLNYFSYLNEINKDNIQRNKDFLLELLELEDKRNEPVNNLSRGMQQKVAILVAILKDPKILILDEPTLGLDIVSQIKMKDLLKKLSKDYKKTIIVSSHDISLIKDICDSIVIFNKGRVVLNDCLYSLTLNSASDKYKIVVKNKPYLLNFIKSENLHIESIDNNFIEFIITDLDKLLKVINPGDLYKVDKISNDIEELLKSLGGK